MEKIDILVELFTGRDKSKRQGALDELRITVKTATTSMTSIPKPLKFIGPHYD